MKPGKDYIGVGCGALIVNEKNEVLLMKRSKKSTEYPGLWSRPGGKIEFKENIEDALTREIEEEIGIIIKPIQQLEFTENIQADKHWISLGYLALYISGVVENREPDKCDEIRWFNLNDIPEDTTDYTQHSISVYKNLNKS